MQLEVPWCQFANALQRQFVRSAKQDPANPTRCLSVYDFSYLRNKFFGGRSIVHQKDYDAFWLWYGKCLQVIRFQRHILQLWQNGYVCPRSFVRSLPRSIAIDDWRLAIRCAM